MSNFSDKIKEAQIRRENAIRRGYKFEETVVELLKSNGFQAYRTNRSNPFDIPNVSNGFDGGVDIIVTYPIDPLKKRTAIFYIQCKNQNRAVKSEDITSVYGGMKARKADSDIPVLISALSSASTDMLRFAKQLGVEMILHPEWCIIQNPDGTNPSDIDDNAYRNGILFNILLYKKTGDTEYQRRYLKLFEHHAELYNQALRDKVLDHIIENHYLPYKELIEKIKKNAFEKYTAQDLESMIFRSIFKSDSYKQWACGIKELTEAQREVLYLHLNSMRTKDTTVQAQVPTVPKSKIHYDNRKTVTGAPPELEVKCCFHCGSISIKKHVKTTKGAQRFICKDCHKTFTDSHNSILYYSHLTEKQLKSIVYGLASKQSLSEIAKETGLSAPTIWSYRIKIYKMLQDVCSESDVFSGVAEADGKYLRLSFKGKRDASFFTNQLGRMPRHHRGRAERAIYLKKHGLYDTLFKEKAGLLCHLLKSSQRKLTGQTTIDRDHQQICLATIADGLGNLYIEPICAGKPNANTLYKAMHERLEQGAVLVTDELRSYKYYTRTDNIVHISINSAEHTHHQYNLARVNSVHGLLDEFISKDKGNQPATKYLDLYLVMFRWLFQRRKLSITEKKNTLYQLVTGNTDTRPEMNHITIAELQARSCSFTVPTESGRQIVIN